jgi:hypothetical protein
MFGSQHRNGQRLHSAIDWYTRCKAGFADAITSRKIATFDLADYKNYFFPR